MNKFGGDFVRPYQPEGYYAPLNFPAREYKASEGDDQFRRAVYVHWQRQFPHPWLVAFDAPSRTECTADRAPSNTPNAAMVLLNDPSYVEAARALAARVLGECSDTGDRERIAWAWRMVLGREATGAEVDELQRLVDEHRTQYAADRAAAEALSVGGQLAAAGEHRRCGAGGLDLGMPGVIEPKRIDHALLRRKQWR